MLTRANLSGLSTSAPKLVRVPLTYTRQNKVEGTTGEGRSFASALPDGISFHITQGRCAAIAVLLKELMRIWMVDDPVSG
jgi:hypothetical protein